MPEVLTEIEGLDELNLEQLREKWRTRFGMPPRIGSPQLFRLMLAWRMQMAVQGGLDPNTRAALRRSGRVVAEGQNLGQGAIIKRQWQGQEVLVEVVDGGFAWNGETFKSLSAVATAITGSRWNGPKFFGLRQ